MKKLLIASLVILSGFANAREFEGTMPLKGSLKSKVWISGLETTCRADIKKVRNILDEDSSGNPGYTVRVNVKLDGRDLKKKIEVKFEQEATLSNFFKVGSKVEARDLNYFDETTGMTMDIDYHGRIKNIKVSYQGQRITCLF